MRNELLIEDVGTGKRVATNTKVWVIERDKDGNETGRTDISRNVRAIDIPIRVGNVLTANLEVFVSGVTVQATLDELRLFDMKPRRRSWRARLRDVTTFGSHGVREYV